MDLDLAFVASASSTSKKRRSAPSCSSSGVKKSLRKNSKKKTIKKLECKDKKAKDKKKSKQQKSKDHEKVCSKDSKKNKSHEKQTEKDKCPKIVKKKLAMMSKADSFMTELLDLSLVDTQPSPLLPGKVRIGSDCSGLGTDAVAVKLSLSGHEDVDVRCAFVSEFDSVKRSLLKAVHKYAGLGKASVIYDDVKTRSIEHPQELPDTRVETTELLHVCSDTFGGMKILFVL